MNKWITILAGFFGPCALWYFLWRLMNMYSRGRVKTVGIYVGIATAFVFVAIALSLLITVFAWRTMLKKRAK
ncbi:MAG: hypothetical protein ABSG92_07170 [Conexivisphaerales archaeon]